MVWNQAEATANDSEVETESGKNITLGKSSVDQTVARLEGMKPLFGLYEFVLTDAQLTGIMRKVSARRERFALQDGNILQGLWPRVSMQVSWCTVEICVRNGSSELR